MSVPATDPGQVAYAMIIFGIIVAALVITALLERKDPPDDTEE